MGVKRRGLGAVAVAGAVWLSSGRARAHPELSALGTNRYVTAAVFDGRVDVTDARLVGLLPSGDERRRADGDHDGRIDATELAAASARLVGEGPAVGVEVDGRALAAPLEVSIDLGGEPRADGAPLVIEGRQSFGGAWPPGEHRLRLVVEREPTRLLETELAVVLGPGLALRSGPDRVLFKGPRASALEERAATFVIAATARTAPDHRARLVAGVAALCAAALLAASAWRRRARGARTSARG
jgi:hypothetical protein